MATAASEGKVNRSFGCKHHSLSVQRRFRQRLPRVTAVSAGSAQTESLSLYEQLVRTRCRREVALTATIFETHQRRGILPRDGRKGHCILDNKTRVPDRSHSHCRCCEARPVSRKPHTGTRPQTFKWEPQCLHWMRIQCLSTG